MQEPRTECDLAEALVTLERYAPEPHAVLRGLRGRPRRRPPGGAGPLVLAAVASAAARRWSWPCSRQPGRGGPAARPRRATQRHVGGQGHADRVRTPSAAMWSTRRRPGSSNGVPADVYRFWTWPAQPAPGQRLLSRTLVSGRSSASAAVEPIEDKGSKPSFRRAA